MKYLCCFVERCNSYFIGGINWIEINTIKALNNLNDIFKTIENYLENISQINIQEIIYGPIQLVGWRKRSKKKQNMKKVINLVVGNKSANIVMNSFDDKR
ncbi:hypothetical protein PBNK65E_000492900 [Plasmodium berghei]|uniref:Uncharacterized protein n=1 Tax=Plasmodium berghei TaxID=5821 RepID=A0A0Y9U616_PLABE|nr:hypothetical protein PBK173_000049800 [Plasmodium berghei]SBW38104.1 hypothetical protein PBNK65E_000492900 [Plasmodium berghei]SCL81402.1 hypothetical protein PBSP11RLL_000489700 [Plasmodium berghei]SCL81620.1 hypothetical protein PBNK65NY_000489700 [Plasmodium berghei]SCM15460.1 hypothetical protein PBSP11A_000047500 [Plasmodium berghei]